MFLYTCTLRLRNILRALPYCFFRVFVTRRFQDIEEVTAFAFLHNNFALSHNDIYALS
jgi:hypothetical protein